MKHPLPYLTVLGIVFVSLSAAPAADVAPVAPAPKADKKQLRVLAAPEPERRVYVQHAEKHVLEKETVAFLGVETSPVSATTGVQLGLPRGTGLVVNQLVPKSPAADALKVHDILLNLDDQILIEVRQLSVLIRNRKEGDEVTLTYLRGGQKATAKVKLGRQEVPKLSALVSPAEGARVFRFDGSGGEALFERRIDEGDREEIDRVLSLIRRPAGAPGMPPGASSPRIRIERSGGPGFRSVAVHPGNSNLVFSDDGGSLELTLKDGAKALVAKDPKGGQLFAGPVTTPEERAALPQGVRERLEKLEGMHDITFHTDGDFQGAETRVIRPRGIAFPISPTEGVRPRVPGPRFH